MIPYFCQTTHLSSTLTGDKNVSNTEATKFPEFSTQIALGGMSAVSESIPNAHAVDSAHARRINLKWTTDQNLVLLGR